VPIVGKLEREEDRRLLLRLSREAAARELGVTTDQTVETPHVEGTFGGAFVTFWAGKTLRGCVGRFGPTSDIARTIEEVTNTSLADARFAANPITGAELPSLNIEISILSDLELTDDPLSLIPGTHGIVVRRGDRSGCFLPKVASDRSWSAEEFLTNCCRMKAGLPDDAWQEPDTEVHLFTADVFAESDFA
jgi:AmmeMemoRadiSam system protein A